MKHNPPPEAATLGVVCGVASIRTGALVQAAGRGEASPELENLAATLPEIFGTVDPSCLNRIAMQLGSEASAERLGEVLLLSEQRVHIIQALANRPGQALVAVSPRGRSVGLILSEVHAQKSALGREE